MCTALFHRLQWRTLLLSAAAYLLTGLHADAQAQVAVIGILEGQATLLRPAGKLELTEGVVLSAADIVETAPAGFMQIEFADGMRLALGESSRLMLAAVGAASAANPTRARLLQGWMKLTPGTEKPIAGDFLTPLGAIGSLTGVCVLHAQSEQHALFVESGSITLTQRGGGARQVKAGEFLAGRGNTELTASARLGPEFVQSMPRLFRDALPARAAKFRDRPATPRALGAVSYDDVAAWLQAEEAIRVPLIDSWRVLLIDKSFHAAVLANLARHPEWRVLVLPPPKKPVIRPLPAPRAPPPGPAAASSSPS